MPNQGAFAKLNNPVAASFVGVLAAVFPSAGDTLEAGVVDVLLPPLVPVLPFEGGLGAAGGVEGPLNCNTFLFHNGLNANKGAACTESSCGGSEFPVP